MYTYCRECVVDMHSWIQQWMFLHVDVKHITTVLTLIYDNRTGSSVEYWKPHTGTHKALKNRGSRLSPSEWHAISFLKLPNWLTTRSTALLE